MAQRVKAWAGSSRSRVRLYLAAIALIVLAFSLAAGVYRYSLAIPFRYEPFDHNLYLYQAWAFLVGRADLAESHLDTAHFGGGHAVPFPPFPAVVLLPIAAILPGGASPILTGFAVTLVSVGLTALNLIVLKRILRQLEIDSSAGWWISAAFFLGTAYWFSLAWSSGVWFFAHIVHMTCMLLAIHEALGRGRGLLVGLFLGLAFLSRQLALYGLIFLIAALWENSHFDNRRQRVGSVVGLAAGFGMCAAAYLIFNWIRFGNALDTGYNHLALAGYLDERVRRYGLFSPVYLPFNFVSMFVQGFRVEFLPPDYVWPIQLDPFGTSLTFASPFVFVAFRARWKKRLLWAAWLSVGLTVVHTLFYYNNGAFQQNASRFTLDFFPILILLVALGTRRVEERLWKAAVVYSVALNTLALFAIPFVQALAIWVNVYGA